LMRRLTSVVIDVEQQVIPTLVVSHVSILQCLMSYFRNSPVEECMSLEVPMHTVIKFTPVRGGGWSESIHPLFEDDGSIAPAGMHASVSEVSAMTDHASPIWSDQQPLSRTNSLCKKRVE
jgi:broad specificity phosphatase PhoE